MKKNENKNIVYPEGYLDFKARLYKRLDEEEPIEISGDEISVLDVLDALRNKFSKYNNAFFMKLYKDITTINAKNGHRLLSLDTENKKYSRVGNIGFYVDKYGYYYCRVYFVDGYDRVIGTTDVDNTVKLNACADEANRNKKIFMKYLNILAEFVQENPGMEYRWDALNPFVPKMHVGDDFITKTIDLYNLEGNDAFLTNRRDYELSNFYDRGIYGRLSEHLSMYGTSLLHRTPINLNDVDPFVADIVRKEYNMGGPELKID